MNTVNSCYFALMNGSVIGEVLRIDIFQRYCRTFPLFTIMDPLYGRLKCTIKNRRPSELKFSSDIHGYRLYARPLCAISNSY